MAHLKTSIIEVKAEVNCLAHALIIAIARVGKDSKYDLACPYSRSRACHNRRPVTTSVSKALNLELHCDTFSKTHQITSPDK